MKQKLCSRKFWVAVAAFLFSVSNSIAGMATSNQTLVILGTVCGTISAAIYAFSEAYTDAARALTPQKEKEEPAAVLEPAIGFEAGESYTEEEE